MLAKAIRDITSYLRVANQLKEFESGSIIVRATTNPDEILGAERLVASQYLRRGFIEPREIDESGARSISADPEKQHATVYIALDPANESTLPSATGRLIRATTDGWMSFPVLRHKGIKLDQLTGDLKLEPQFVSEFSALAKAPGKSPLLPLALYRAMLADSLKNGNKAWVMACDPRLFQRLRLLFGSAIIQIGPNLDYPGAQVVPTLLDLRRVESELHRLRRDKLPVRSKIRRAIADYLLGGLPK